MSPELVFALLIGAAFLAGYVDAIAGGGGMIAIPALLLAGLDPLAAIGTNKAQALFGTASASLAYARKGHVDVKLLLPAMGIAAGGAVVGGLAAQVIPTEILARLLPFLLIAVAIYFALKPGISDIDGARRLSPALFALVLVPGGG